MKGAVRHLASRLRSSFWFLPTVMALGGGALAVAALRFDAQAPPHLTRPLHGVVAGGPEGVRSLLATLTGSTVTVTGVLFSITIVTLSLASNQFGPRLLRSFMRDRANQAVLGTFIATFAYCVVALMNVGSDAQEVPRATVFGAFLLTATSLAVLIHFLHHVALSIQADTVVAAVASDLERRIDRFYPDPQRPGEAQEPPLPVGPSVRLDARRTGYVQAIDEDALAEAAHALGLVVQCHARPGSFVVEGRTVLEAWPARALSKRERRRLLRPVLLGVRRTEEQDVAYAFGQLSQVAVRALSPALNDPFTAAVCVDRLGSALRRLAGRAVPSPRVLREGVLRAVVPRASFAELAEDALGPLRRNARGSAHVLSRLLEAVATAAEGTHDPERLAVLRQHAQRVVWEARQGSHHPDDLAAVERQGRRLLPAA